MREAGLVAHREHTAGLLYLPGGPLDATHVGTNQ